MRGRPDHTGRDSRCSVKMRAVARAAWCPLGRPTGQVQELLMEVALQRPGEGEVALSLVAYVSHLPCVPSFPAVTGQDLPLARRGNSILVLAPGKR